MGFLFHKSLFLACRSRVPDNTSQDVGGSRYCGSESGVYTGRELRAIIARAQGPASFRVDFSVPPGLALPGGFQAPEAPSFPLEPECPFSLLPALLDASSAASGLPAALSGPTWLLPSKGISWVTETGSVALGGARRCWGQSAARPSPRFLPAASRDSCVPLRGGAPAPPAFPRRHHRLLGWVPGCSSSAVQSPQTGLLAGLSRHPRQAWIEHLPRLKQILSWRPARSGRSSTLWHLRHRLGAVCYTDTPSGHGRGPARTG